MGCVPSRADANGRRRPSGRLLSLPRALARASLLSALGLALAAPVDEVLLALLHEPLELLLEFRVHVPPPARRLRLPIRRGLLDRQVDLAIILDTDHLHRDLVVLTDVVRDIPDEVAVDLRDVDEARLS